MAEDGLNRRGLWDAAKDTWNRIFRTYGDSALDESSIRLLQNTILYNVVDEEFFRKSYSENGDVFSVINKIVEPAKSVPIKQVNKDTLKEAPGKALKLLQNPNPMQNVTEFIEGAMTFYYIFGENLIVGNSVPDGINKGQPLRLDLLPPQAYIMQLGTTQQPVRGWRARWSTQLIDYSFEEVFHYRDFNPNYDETGYWLRGMSRLKPIYKAVMGSDAGYDTLVGAFQHMGAYGVLTILGVPTGDGYTDAPRTKQQIRAVTSEIENKYYGAKNKGKIVATNKEVKWTNLGIRPVDLEVINALHIFSGRICDAYNVPDILLSGGKDSKKYNNYQQALNDLWMDAVIPGLNNFLDKFSSWLMPRFPGEENTRFMADYSGVNVLVEYAKDTVKWMVDSGVFTMNEIRAAANKAPLTLDNMDVPLIPNTTIRIDQMGQIPVMPLAARTEKELKYYTDYRK